MLSRHPWRVLLVVAALAGLAVAAPHLWAWYHLRAARDAVLHYHHAEAREHLEKCLKVWPSSIEAHLLACRVARREGNFDEAQEHLRECQRAHPGPSEQIALEWAMLRASMGDLEGVETYLLGQARGDPARAALVFEALVEGYSSTYRVPDALNCLERWFKQDPDNVRALALRGNLWWSVHVPKNALPDYRRVVELDPDNGHARERLAQCLLEAGHFDEALPLLTKLHGEKPDDPDWAARLARCRNLLGQSREAREMLEAVLREHPDHGLTLRTLGQMALADRKPAEAEKFLERAVRATPNDTQSQWSLYDALHRLGKDEEAARQKKRAQDVEKRAERIAEIGGRLLANSPHDPALQCELGKLLLERGDFKVGAAWLRSALKEDPNHRPALEALAAYHEARGEKELAQPYRQRLAESGPRP